MPIIKPGFEEGFRARRSAAAFGRRAYYLANPEGRESAVLLGKIEEELSPDQAIQVMGGKQAEYHEVIVAPSALECQAIRERSPNPERAEREAAHRLAQAYAGERAYVVAVHGSEDGRFHFHITVPGPYPEHLDGERGIMQRVWNENWVIQERRSIRNWMAWREYQTAQAALKEAEQEVRQLSRLRRVELKDIPAEGREPALTRFKEAELDLALKKADLERRSIQARFRAFGRSGTVFEAVELEQAGQRHTKVLRQIEGRNLRAELEGAWGQVLGEIRELRARALAAEPGQWEAALQAYLAAQGDLLGRHRRFEEACAKREWERSEGRDPRVLTRSLAEVAQRFQARVEQMDLGFRLDEVRGALQRLRGEKGLEREARERALLEERRDLRIRILDTEMVVRGRMGSPEHRRQLETLMAEEGRRLGRSGDEVRISAELQAARARMRELRAELFPPVRGREAGQGFAVLQRELEEVSRRILTLELAGVEQARRDLQAQADADLERARAFRERCGALQAQRLLTEAQAERERSGVPRLREPGAGQGRGDQAGSLGRAIQLEVAALALLQPGADGALQRALPVALGRVERELAGLDQREAQLRARFRELEVRQGLEGQIREVREGLQRLREAQRQELRAAGAHPEAVLARSRSLQEQLWERLAALEERRLQARFPAREGLDSLRYREALDRLRDDQFLRVRIRDLREAVEVDRCRYWRGFGLGHPAELAHLKERERQALAGIHQLERTRVELRHRAWGTLGSAGCQGELRRLDQDLARNLERLRERPLEPDSQGPLRLARAVRRAAHLHGRAPEELLVRAASVLGNRLLRQALARVPAVRVAASLVRSIELRALEL